jgi:Arylsulfotransferase (ASST)
MRDTLRSLRRIARRPLHRRLRVGLLAAAVAVAGVGARCQPAPPRTLSISTSPGLFPSFSPTVTDYVSRCSASTPVEVTVSAPDDTTVAVDDDPAASGNFSATVSRDVGQRFRIAVQKASEATRTYNIRCIPSDFPTWTAQRTGETQADFYVTTLAIDGLTGTNYPAIFDTNGVPVWWAPRTNTFFTEVLPGGNVAWTQLGTPGGAEEHDLDGSLIRSVETVSGPTDWHDFITLPNGNDVLVTIKERSGDLSPWGGPTDATVLDHVLEEIRPDGTVAWSWSTADHIPVTETTARWRTVPPSSQGAYDPFHYNSVEYTGDGFILSFRHLDAIYKVDQTSGTIDWKLGGTRRSESLGVVDDPVFDAGGTFSGQHDARVLGDGTVSLHDNGTGIRPPRVVNYRIDETARSATLVRDVRDPLVSSSFCCGSARVLPTGNYVMGWGGSRTFTEMTPAGERVFLLQTDSGNVYRALPTPPGALTIDELRAGMDTQFGTGGAQNAN